MTRVFNFSAGPAALPEPVLRQAAEEMLDWHGSGMSVMEMSHRGKEFISIHAEAEGLLRELLGVPANYKVLFMQGGAIGENAIVPMNLLRGKNGRPTTSTPASGRRSRSRKRKKYWHGQRGGFGRGRATSRRIPQQRRAGSSIPTLPTCTSARNETIGGVEYHWTPDTGAVPLVADMSSQHPVAPDRRAQVRPDLRRRAEEHRAPRALTIVIVRDDLIGQALPITPSAFNYKMQADNDSMYNTPPTYAIYIAGLVFKWIKAQGGLHGDGSAQPQAKAAMLYDYLDDSAFYRNARWRGKTAR